MIREYGDTKRIAADMAAAADSIQPSSALPPDAPRRQLSRARQRDWRASCRREICASWLPRARARVATTPHILRSSRTFEVTARLDQPRS